MTNADVAAVFHEIADLLEIQGADGFRVNAYRKVARAVDDLGEDIGAVRARGELAKLPGVGKSSAEKLAELLDTGRLAFREQLLAEVPASLLELLQIQGVGPKKVALLWKERGIETLDDLRAALDEGGLDNLPGFGRKSVEQLRQGLTFLRSAAGRRRLDVAGAVAEHLRDAVAELPGVQRVEIAGSLRRGREDIGDIDLLCIADEPPETIQRFAKLTQVQQVLGAGQTKASVLIEYRPRRTIQVDLRALAAESFGAAWLYFTGSQAHNVRLRERAQQRGWSLSEYGLTADDRVVAAKTEEEIYAALDLPWLPPELREDRFEFDLQRVPAELLTLDDIRGDLHMHTTASDGVNTPAQMVAAAQQRGYDYVCITDHSKSQPIANGLNEKRLREHMAQVRELAGSTKGVAVWIGAEVDILAKGKLDYADELLAELDFVVASLHNHAGDNEQENTRRVLAAIENPYVNLIAHPTARLINQRPPMALDLAAVCQAAAETGTALEINASAHRLDLKDMHARYARDAGAVISINTDAHAVDQLDQMRYGVVTARRGGLLRGDVLNTWPVKRVRAFVAKKREQT